MKRIYVLVAVDLKEECSDDHMHELLDSIHPPIQVQATNPLIHGTSVQDWSDDPTGLRSKYAYRVAS